MNIEVLTLGPIQTNCFILWDHDGNALVIDPSAEAERIIGFLESRQLTVLAYPLTHGHVDHVSALAEVHTAYPAPVGMHPADLAWAFEPINQLPPFYGPPDRPTEVERLYEDGQEWVDAGWSYRVIFTPGHTPGGVSFYFPQEKVVFSGDALFRGSVGRTDLPGGDALVLTQTLKRLAELPDDTAVYPGHGDATTIGTEKRTNFFMRGGVPG